MFTKEIVLQSIIQSNVNFFMHKTRITTPESESSIGYLNIYDCGIRYSIELKPYSCESYPYVLYISQLICGKMNINTFEELCLAFATRDRETYEKILTELIKKEMSTNKSLEHSIGDNWEVIACDDLASDN